MTNVERVNELKKELKSTILQFFQVEELSKVKLTSPFNISVSDSDMLGDYYLSQETVTHVDEHGQVYLEWNDNGLDIMDLDICDIAFILDELLATNYTKVDETPD